MAARWTTIVFGFLLAASVVLTGCALNPADDPAFQDAQHQLDAARADPDVMKYASGPLSDATDTLDAARKATKPAQLNHLTYLAGKKIEIARTVAEARAAESRLQSLANKPQSATAAPKRVEREHLPPVATSADAKTGQRDQQALQAAREAQEKVRSLEKALAEFQTREAARSIVLTLPDVSFAPGETRLTPSVTRRLSPLADYLKANPRRKVVVKGYTDDTGSHEVNIALSNQRAQAVKTYLVHNHVDAGRILTIGYGEADPVASNKTAGGRRENRRVEIVLVDARTGFDR